jgi:hypothetical protein
MAATRAQQINYIAPAAPARRESATGDEPFLRPEIGFTPNWFRQNLRIDFGKPWHTDPAYRRETVIEMRKELRRRFPGTSIGRIDRPDKPLDLLTGLYGGNPIAMIYGLDILYAQDNWPNYEHKPLTTEQLDALEPPDLDKNPVWQDIMRQCDWIIKSEGRLLGHINWQGILNNAHRLRGENLFLDLFDSPAGCRHLFDCIYTTMSECIRRMHHRQNETGVETGFVTVSNCLVNMISPDQYRELFLPYDLKFAAQFASIAIHNCAWNADPYLEDYSKIENLGYVDMGIKSNMARARNLIPGARRALMYTPMDLANNDWKTVKKDVERIAREFGPCDLVVADIEADTPDEKIKALLDLCKQISDRKENQQK